MDSAPIRFLLLLLSAALALPLNAQDTTPPRPAYQPQQQPPAPPPGNTLQGQQPPPGTFTIQRTARLVVLDLVVVDSKGNVVKGLTRDDFHVEETGEPQNILNFEEAGKYTPDPQASIESTTDLDRLAPHAPVNIILLDEFNTRFEDMAFARYSLKKYLEKQPDKLTTPTMLIAVDLQHFTILRDYTQNKQELISALDHHFVAYPWQTHQYTWLNERYATAFITLRRVAQAVVGHPGHKNMIWIGRGFPPYNFATAPVDASQRVESAVQDCVNTLRDARVTLYTIDPAGLMIDPGKYGAAAAFNDPFGGEYQFNRLAKATGGRTLYGRNDVDAQIGTAIQDGGNFYTLTYRPTSSSNDPRQFRKIKVTLSKPGLSVITREGYYPQRGPGRVDPQNPSKRLMMDLVSADTSNMTYDGVAVTLEKSQTDPASYTLHVDPKGLVWSYGTLTEPRHAEVILVVSTFDKKGKELKRDAKIIKANAPSDAPLTGRLERGLNIEYKIDPNPKAVRARFTLRVTATGRIGTADAELAEIKKPS